jgi:hypothetical protein
VYYNIVYVGVFKALSTNVYEGRSPVLITWDCSVTMLLCVYNQLVWGVGRTTYPFSVTHTRYDEIDQLLSLLGDPLRVRATSKGTTT